jgi:hypothetical protein
LISRPGVALVLVVAVALVVALVVALSLDLVGFLAPRNRSTGRSRLRVRFCGSFSPRGRNVTGALRLARKAGRSELK